MDKNFRLPGYTENLPGSSENNDTSKGASDQTTGIFVSLYLIVLAFFMVMNSISNQEENRVAAATESVTRAFKNPFEPEADFVDVTSDPEAQTPNDEFYAQIQGVFASLVGFEGKFPTQGGHIIVVKFEANDLFERGTAQFRLDQQNFLNQLAAFLKGGRTAERREIDFLVYTGRDLPQGPKYWEDLHILRAGAIVHRLKNMGVPEEQISTGVVQGDKNKVEITFYNRERLSSIQSLERQEEPFFPVGGGRND
ncbi:OmpA family protein [Luteithermobacter gelatinilyticus]|uniref:OmpA family protein n=1 Tax=Luteithermobacter gelatinilyticus TaxID=2582913 RepID=UPI0011071592|nr:OmpA family protein [Luteithermobacter gelatinilyticus]|tara:strand:- start:9888 stop:10646 length:759 start_codon:yes stop_codon:yes gene_type:complete